MDTTGRGKAGRRKLTWAVAGLVAVLTVLSGPAFAGRSGAQVRVRLLNGGRVIGELIAVLDDKIIVKSAVIESSVRIADIGSITVEGDLEGWSTAKTLGIVAGIALGCVASSAYARWYHDKYDGIPVYAPFIGIAGGALLGGAIGEKAAGGGKDKIFEIGGRPPGEVAKIMAKLKRKARLRNAY